MATALLTPPVADIDPVPATDVDILTRVRTGDLAAFGLLYERDSASASRYAARLVGPAEAGDVVSDAFARVLAAIVNGAGPRDHHLKYLMVTVRHAAFDRLRQRHPVPIEHTDVTTTSGADEPLDWMLDEDMHEAFNALPSRWQQVLWWTEVTGRSMAEIGDELGLSPAAAAAVAYRARRALRTAYEHRTGRISSGVGR